jgi:flagellar motility protein MotE (MotC chaperone)
MMGKILSIALVIAGLVVGFLGSYFAMPLLRPAYVEAINARLDSLSTPADTLATTADSTGPDTSDEGLIESMEDSLARLQRRVDELKRQSDAALSSRSKLEAQVDSLSEVRSDATELASALTQLEDKELAKVVGELDDRVLKALYLEASRKNQARILQAMPPDRAARFIRMLYTKTVSAPGRAVTSN